MKNIFLIVFCLLVSTVWAKEEKNKRIQYCTTLEEAMQQAARKHKPIFFNCYAGWAGRSTRDCLKLQRNRYLLACMLWKKAIMRN